MLVEEIKTEDGYRYNVPIQDGTIEYFCDKAIRTDNTEKTLDAIFQQITARPNGEGQLTQDGYIISYKKKIDLWLKE